MAALGRMATAVAATVVLFFCLTISQPTEKSEEKYVVSDILVGHLRLHSRRPHTFIGTPQNYSIASRTFLPK